MGDSHLPPVAELGPVGFAIGAFLIGFASGWANGSAVVMWTFTFSDVSVFTNFVEHGFLTPGGWEIPFGVVPAAALLGGVATLAAFVADFSVVPRGEGDE